MTRQTSTLSLHGCGWATVSLSAAEMREVQDGVRGRHAGRALVISCQRLEAFGDSTCDCGAPEQWTGPAAVERIAQVAAGLHSAVLGEDQIMGQVRAAFAEAPASVRRLADIAIASARELRRQTHFDSHAGHLLDRGLRLAGLAAEGRLLVLGTGAMGRLVASRGVDLGFAEVLIAGRTEPEDAAANGWRFVPLAEIADVGHVSLIAGCLGSAAGEFGVGQLPPAGLLLDLGTPRNFVTNESVLTIADMMKDEENRTHSIRRRGELQAQLSEIVERRLARAEDDSKSLVGKLRAEVEQVRQREMTRAARLHPELSPELLETLTRSLVDQIFHRPSTRLRAMDDEELGRELVALFAED